MKFDLKIIAILLTAGLAATKAKAQGYQNKKSTGMQTFTLRLTKPASTSVDLSSTANKYLNGGSDTQTAASSKSSETSGLTVTDVSTESKEGSTTGENRELVLSNDRIQVITLSKA